MTALLMKKTLITAKNETTYGSAVVPTVSSNALLCLETPDIVPVGEFLERKTCRSTLSPQVPVIGAKHYTFSIETEWKGGGSCNVGSGVQTYPEIHPFLQAAGMEVSATAQSSGGSLDGNVAYKPVSTGFESCTIYFYFDGQFHRTTGARNSIEFAVTAGDYGKITVDGMGLYEGASSVTFPSSPTFDGISPPIGQAASFAFGSLTCASIVLTDFSFKIENALDPAKGLCASEGVSEISLTGRNVTGKLTFETIVEGTENTLDDWENQTTHKMYFTNTVDASAGQKCLIEAPAVTITKPTYADNNGRRMWEAELQFNSTSAAGDDEITITYS